MRTVEDESGRRYVILKKAEEASLVRDIERGTERYLQNEQLSVAEDVSPLEHIATAVPAHTRKVLTAVPNTRALGLLLDLANRGPLSVRTMLNSYEYCESDLHGLLAEFTAAGLVEKVDVRGERGYAITEEVRPVVESLQSVQAEES
jgi:transcriptional regulator of met regulon